MLGVRSDPLTPRFPITPFGPSCASLAICYNVTMKFDILKWAYESQFQAAVKGVPHSVLVALAYSANFKTEACFPSIKRLSFLTRLKPTAVKSGLAILKKEGFITVASGKGKRKTNRYAFNYNKIKKTKTVNAVSDVTCQTMTWQQSCQTQSRCLPNRQRLALMT